jgi:hypothetical protein
MKKATLATKKLNTYIYVQQVEGKKEMKVFALVTYA